ncbi:uncharacterized protein Z519_04683 [Cladophialophora bantiana CBS 173.52]|uniref:Diphthine--ammonia ligase n=1 Tax=Cladophialophora bantiana (strain ATCC 10958 / CBS 173.52 / CDC B-1940 / NIH 8579) TaxID=1442370 RepID=A0A0D2EXL3_CLAB1|nr:uncharacterized protein Z519_04683 [Cladophialophora bantiana CBS 173.52]KIW94706.1 hypothetical protein Z519_04683 [Cladophialophora bantiana CBS 173.52]
MSSNSLNVIALISGGKDSLFSILHCLENGHQVVALANLYPGARSVSNEPRNASSVEISHGDGESEEGEDLNSFMYQTVGHSVIPLYEECLGIPLYRREITGSAVQMGRYYDASDLGSTLDETEDLIPLLRDVMQMHPEVNALCSGAILSTYQRTRVESVAVRLGLTPLAYLWQYPALPPPNERGESLTGLLDDMRAAGCDARIIKIASGGIKESSLWANVADPRTQLRLVNGLRPFFPDHEFWLRGAVLGEGGEYETLAVNGPRRLWRRRVVVPPEQQSTFTGEGGVSYLRLGKPGTEENHAGGSETQEKSLRVPQPFDPQFQAVVTTVKAQERASVGRNAEKLDKADTQRSRRMLKPSLQPVKCLTSGCVSICNITSGEPSLAESPSSAASQMQRICDVLKSMLESMSSSLNIATGLTPSNIISTTLLLKDMSSFGAVNPIYASLFRSGEPNPPARVTIACPLPENIQVSLSVLIDAGPRDARRGLHVQSRSYWAPANIGPYSQAICVPVDKQEETQINVHDAGVMEMVHMAGQIPLVPSSMNLSQAGFLEETALSLQHLWRVGQERGVDMWPWGIAFLEGGCTDGPVRPELSCRVWQQAHLTGTRSTKAGIGEEDDEADEGPDAWDLRYNRASTYEVSSGEMTVGQHLHLLPNANIFLEDGSSASFVPPFVAAEVVSLPRGAPVEWWSMGITNLPKSPASKPRVSAVRKDWVWGSMAKVTILPPYGKSGTTVHLITALVCHRADVAGVESDILNMIVPDSGYENSSFSPAELVHGTAFITLQAQEEWSRMRRGHLLGNLAAIPCNSLFGSSGGVSSPAAANNLAVSSLPAVKFGTDIQGPAALYPPLPLGVAMVMRVDQSARQSR